MSKHPNHSKINRQLTKITQGFFLHSVEIYIWGLKKKFPALYGFDSSTNESSIREVAGEIIISIFLHFESRT